MVGLCVRRCNAVMRRKQYPTGSDRIRSSCSQMGSDRRVRHDEEILWTHGCDVCECSMLPEDSSPNLEVSFLWGDNAEMKIIVCLSIRPLVHHVGLQLLNG